MSKLKLGLDISLVSTALSIRNTETGDEKYISFLDEREKYKKKYTEQFLNDISKYIDFVYMNQDFNILNTMKFEEKEYEKLVIFRKNAKIIASQIYDLIKDDFDNYTLNIEHYSYNSMSNNIIEIVAFSTFIKDELLDRDIKFNMKSPLTIKQEICRMIYGSDKKGIARRPDGLAGGSFKKPDMLLALKESNFNSNLKTCVIEFDSQINRTKEIAKPIDDIVDSYFISYM